MHFLARPINHRNALCLLSHFSWQENCVLANVQPVSVYRIFLHCIGANNNVKSRWILWCIENCILDSWSGDALQSNVAILRIFECLSRLHQRIASISIPSSVRTKFRAVCRHSLGTAHARDARRFYTVFGVVIGWTGPLSILYNWAAEKGNPVTHLVPLFSLDHFVSVGRFLRRNNSTTKPTALRRNQTVHHRNAESVELHIWHG